MNKQTKWVLIVFVAMLIFVVFVLLCALLSTGQEVLFFENWEIKIGAIRPDGLLQATLVNPDPESKIRAVVILIAPPDKVLAYWYFDENKNPKVFVFKGDKYVPDEETAKGCIRCHNH